MTDDPATLRRQIAAARQRWQDALHNQRDALSAAQTYLDKAIEAGEEVRRLEEELERVKSDNQN